MKTYNVKSNAKRAAKKIIARFALDAVILEPAPTGTDGEWFASIEVDTKADLPAEVVEAVKITRRIRPKTMKPGLVRPQRAPKTRRAPKAAPDVATLAASLPPRKDSSPEEIAARRAERRERVQREKAEGKRDARGAKVRHTREDIILRMTAKDGGAPIDDICAACGGWERHTLRAYIGGVLRKRLEPKGKTIVAVRRTAARPGRYILKPLEAAE